MKQLLLSILSKGVKDNTYKFALAKFLLDFSHHHPLEKNQVISYTKIAEKFLEYYWFQECKYKLKQDFKIERKPIILRIIHKHCGTEYIHESFEKYFETHESKNQMIDEIEKGCLQDVIPRFQPAQNYILYNHFHTISPSGKKYHLPSKDQRYIEMSFETHRFLKENYHELSKILIYEWAKFLEKTNFTPRLIAKIENLGHRKRESLTKYKKILLEQSPSQCFYCNYEVNNDDIHIDHFIPWSYIYEDALWNLVISCSRCNLKKSDNLASRSYIDKIQTRNDQLKFNEYKKDLVEYYENCQKAGFFTNDKLVST